MIFGHSQIHDHSRIAGISFQWDKRMGNMYGVIVLAILVTLATGLTLLKDKKEGK